jgi:hypothetical protein
MLSTMKLPSIKMYGWLKQIYNIINKLLSFDMALCTIVCCSVMYKTSKTTWSLLLFRILTKKIGFKHKFCI